MISCCWMGIPLHSPLVLASLTLCSKPDVQKHVAYFAQAVGYGVGAIVLPSIHPLRVDESVGAPHVRTTMISTGLHSTKDYMGFAVLGTTDNIVSVGYGLALAKKSVKLGVPIIGSVANIGAEKDFLHVIRNLMAVHGLAGLELNFSCPNVLNGLKLSVELLEKVNEVVGGKLPVSIKLAPKTEYTFLLSNQHLFDGLTLSNAYTGLIPPNVLSKQITPFGDMDPWRPTGMYGPQEKLLTFYDIWKLKSMPESAAIQLSSVGGFVNGVDVIQALMLGADCVQLSSAVFWNGLAVIRECNNCLTSFLNQHSLSLSQLKGSGLSHILESDAQIHSRPVRRMRVDPCKCRNCRICSCVERSCYAFEQISPSTIPIINAALCSGCGWCQGMCKFNAIESY